jgi:uncharacterized protein (DUF697 family)
MNRSLLLHVVERLESLVGKLPTTIQKPILSELTPLKELFLQQRPPRLLFTGSERMKTGEVIDRILFPAPEFDRSAEIHIWQDLNLPEHGTISIFDARGLDARQIEEEVKRQPADIIVFINEVESARGPRKIDIDNLRSCLRWNDETAANSKVIAITISSSKRKRSHDGEVSGERVLRLRSALESDAITKERLLEVVSFVPGEGSADIAKRVMSILVRELPNQARIEMIRISRDKDAQNQVAQVLVKSTTAICTAIGAQPIPLADMPILTTLQLVMVSGIMYISGRERSLRAATEFVGALGANVGAGMLLREGTRAILKFFPGWGNVVCGMVAGAGTYAIGRAAIVFFLEGVSLKDARRIYLTSRKRRVRPALLGDRKPPKEGTKGK